MVIQRSKVFVYGLLGSTMLVSPLRAQSPGQSDPAIAQQYQVPQSQEPSLSPARIRKLVSKDIKYVFVLYQENRSFDSYFGTYPGAAGLYSQPASQTPGFTQDLITTSGSTTTIRPFRIGPAQFAADTDDINHSHPVIVAKENIVGGHPLMNNFAVAEERVHTATGNPSLLAEQFGELAMAHEDCDTVPILWNYADRFALFDHIFQQMTGPSTPGNLSIIAGQSGNTQWVLHPNEAYQANGASSAGEPVLNDNNPLWGSALDPSGSPLVPYNPSDFADTTAADVQLNQTYATIMLTIAGRNLAGEVSQDRAPSTDLADVKDDVGYLGLLNQKPFDWGWFEEGYDHEPTDDDDAGPVVSGGTHASYVTHHNGPQYFGYIANNPAMTTRLHGLSDFFTDVSKGQLPNSGGVFYVKGGYTNLFGLKPTDTDAAVQKNFLGDDDHPGYSDAQISEATLAEDVNAIGASKYWKNSAIIITWDDSEGDYDHLSPPIRTTGPDGSVTGDGPRVPLLVISPYARAHAIVSDQGNHSSVLKFVEDVFGLPPLALLPDELKGRLLGYFNLHQSQLGPEDAFSPDITDLSGAFDPARLAGLAAPLPASYAELPDSLVTTLPGVSGYGCKALGDVPTDANLPNPIPANFNPRPSTDPSTP